MNPQNPQDPNALQPGQMSPDQQQDYSKPVAYDQQGNPLYARPPEGYVQQVPHQVVQVTRSMNPVEQPIPPEIMQRYEESRKKFPNLNLSKGEYVISAIKRHPFGLLQIWFVVIFLILLFGITYVMLFLGTSVQDILATGVTEEQMASAAVYGVISILLVLGGFVASYIYNNNRFYLTNESVIQEIQVTLFSVHEQTVSLSNIEDASYKQNGILPMMFNFGTIRLSTEGDETTYSFTYVANPKRHIAVLNNAVEAFKNGRPVDDSPHLDQSS